MQLDAAARRVARVELLAQVGGGVGGLVGVALDHQRDDHHAFARGGRLGAVADARVERDVVDLRRGAVDARDRAALGGGVVAAEDDGERVALGSPEAGQLVVDRADPEPGATKPPLVRWSVWRIVNGIAATSAISQTARTTRPWRLTKPSSLSIAVCIRVLGWPANQSSRANGVTSPTLTPVLRV